MNAYTPSPKGWPPTAYTLRERCRAIDRAVRDLADQAAVAGFTPDAAYKVIEDAARRHSSANRPSQGRRRLPFSPVPF